MDPYSLIFFALLFLLSAFFSGTEIALMSIPKHKIDSLIKEGKSGSKTLAYIKARNDRLLITILIGNNLVNVSAASLATKIAIDFANNMQLDQNMIIGVSTGIVTLFLLMFGEIFPKTFASKNAEKIALSVAKPYKILMIILSPIVFTIEFINKLFAGKEQQQIVTDEEIEAFIDMGKDALTLEQGQYTKLKNLLDFNERTIEEIMTPRVKIDAISQLNTISQAAEYALSHTHSRLPIYSGSIDRIDFVITTRELLAEIHKGNSNKILKDLKLTKVIKVPLNQPIDTLLEIFQKSKKHLAVVMDEYGGVAGLVTLEDVIEEVFGDIKDETDQEIDEIKKEGDTYKIQPDVLIDELLDEFNLTLTNLGLDENLYGETVSYVITDILERFPSTGEIITFEIKGDDNNIEDKKLEFKMLEVNNGTIGQIEVRII